MSIFINAEVDNWDIYLGATFGYFYNGNVIQFVMYLGIALGYSYNDKIYDFLNRIHTISIIIKDDYSLLNWLMAGCSWYLWEFRVYYYYTKH
jgi:hypothetical protein